jgi:CubicO group peptidase (beta-lactamase class C family)
MMPPAGTALERLVDSLVESGTASAVVALAGGARQIDWCRAAGWARGAAPEGRPAEAATWFDYGSLTKPFVATLGLLLNGSGELPLATPLGAVLGGAHPRLAAVRLGDLLRHGAGMQAWTPLYARCRSLVEVRELLLGGQLLGARQGTYSDLDYLLWGQAAEQATGKSLAALVGERVLAPLGLTAAVTAPPGDLPRVAESRLDGGREAMLAERQGIHITPPPPPRPGEPQDGNARFLLTYRPGGEAITGHAGLFGTAAALWRLGAEWLAPGALLDRGTVAAALAGGGPFALGWWRRRHRGSGGAALSPLSYGHSGFAGGSLWIDPQASRVFVLLAHRLDSASNMNRWRRRFHAAAGRALGNQLEWRQISDEYS